MWAIAIHRCWWGQQPRPSLGPVAVWGKKPQGFWRPHGGWEAGTPCEPAIGGPSETAWKSKTRRVPREQLVSVLCAKGGCYADTRGDGELTPPESSQNGNWKGSRPLLPASWRSVRFSPRGSEQHPLLPRASSPPPTCVRGHVSRVAVTRDRDPTVTSVIFPMCQVCGCASSTRTCRVPERKRHWSGHRPPPPAPPGSPHLPPEMCGREGPVFLAPADRTRASLALGAE